MKSRQSDANPRNKTANNKADEVKPGTLFWRWLNDDPPIYEDPSPDDDELYEDDVYNDEGSDS